MSADSNDSIKKAWDRFLQEVELAKNYHMPHLLNGFGGTFRNPLLDYLLPSLLYVKMVAVLDEALVRVINDRSLTVPRKYRNTLYGRIEFLNDQSLIADYAGLGRVRNLRNLVTHDVSGTATWETLSTDVDAVEHELQHLGFVGHRPNYEYFGERSAMHECDEPGIAFAQDFKFGIKTDGRVTMEVSFTRKTHNTGNDA